MNETMHNQKNKRRYTDGILNMLTYASSAICVLLLLSIFIFIFSKGSGMLGMKLLTGDYWAKNYMTSIQEKNNHPSTYKSPEDASDDMYWSERWGVGFVDARNENNEAIVLVEAIDDASPFAHLKDESRQNKPSISAESGYLLENLSYQTTQGTTRLAGNIVSQDAKTVARLLDQDAVSINKIYFKTPGGGIRGSLLTTLYLIIISLLIALPLGIGAAIYLHEYAAKNKITSGIRSAIEMLTGVPSIIFGLMGVAVLFPLTKLAGADTTNVLLGSLTMAIILLPIIIRPCEEALAIVPQTLRDASLSLGANQSQTIFKIVLPCAVPGILSGVLLSIGRVIGESAALIYTMGTYVNDSPTLLSQGTSLAVHIYNIMSSEQPNFELACAISIVILVFVFMLNLLVKLMSRRFNKAWY